MVTIQARIASRGDKVPTCDTCGHFLLPDTVQFGKPLDHDTLLMAQTVAADCDLFICIGSSLLVQPANLIPAIAVQMNIPLVILNKTYDSMHTCAAIHSFVHYPGEMMLLCGVIVRANMINMPLFD